MGHSSRSFLACVLLWYESLCENHVHIEYVEAGASELPLDVAFQLAGGLPVAVLGSEVGGSGAVDDAFESSHPQLEAVQEVVGDLDGHC